MRKETAEEKRNAGRFNKLFVVVVHSEVFGNACGIGRNISEGGMLIEMADPLPLGSFITVHFRMPDSEGDIVIRAEVKHHYCLNYGLGNAEPSSLRGMGVKFMDFVADSATRFETSFAAQRILH